MNGYLVVARYGGNYLPIGLFESLWEADEFIDGDPVPSETIRDQFDAILAEVISYQVVAFSNGQPVSESETSEAS